jgi:hypothetical protein
MNKSITLNPNIAVVIHLYYVDQWIELNSFLKNITIDFDVFVSIPHDSDYEHEILKFFPNAFVYKVDNVGRDVAPFMQILSKLQSYSAVCKIHTKGNQWLHRYWRLELLNKLLGDSNLINMIVGAFQKDKDLMLLGPRSLYLDGPRYIMGSLNFIKSLNLPEPPNWGFFGGTMFWIRPVAYQKFQEDFKELMYVKHDEKDYHPEHALERLFGYYAALVPGKKVGLVSRGWFNKPKLKLINPRCWKSTVDFGKAYKRFSKKYAD